MVTLRLIFLLALPLVLGACCQTSYIVESAYHQAELLRRRVPISKVLKDPTLSQKVRDKLLLAQQARQFAEQKLGLRHTGNYSTFVQLSGPYVTYAVNAAPKYELVNYLWSFPIVGKVPYLGFFDKNEAKQEAKKMTERGYDSSVRGVTAYSTLGWFKDPILSSMLQYEDYDLVNVIIHETTHATIYIKSSADFNEQLATFIGNEGTEDFYRQKEGPNSPTVHKIKLENQDDKEFSQFINRELASLRQWYASHKGAPNEIARQKRLKQIQLDFLKDEKSKLATDKYDNFAKGTLNNARLLLFQTYFQDLDEFGKAFEAMGHDYPKFIAFCKTLETAADPAAALRAKAQSIH